VCTFQGRSVWPFSVGIRRVLAGASVSLLGKLLDLGINWDLRNYFFPGELIDWFCGLLSFASYRNWESIGICDTILFRES
jgi:hypothetical protein